MPRTDRLFALQRVLQDGALHRAADLAQRLGVSQRTIYRDMETLARSGVPVSGTRGTGYCLADVIALPPLRLTQGEVEALNLGLAILAESTDPELHTAAQSLADKIDAVLPAVSAAPADAWKTAFRTGASAARGFAHMAALRSAIRGRQKLRIHSRDSTPVQTVRPLRLENWGRNWVLTAWSETASGFTQLRTDLIETATPLPELFVDEPGRTLGDFAP